jgi:hypothetical protein
MRTFASLIKPADCGRLEQQFEQQFVQPVPEDRLTIAGSPGHK